ncbi:MULTISPECIES: hypothetical protein [unclassified Variovorax]|uniref:hypothetical protein n=1 Tax=unclassified Variovorax TaxID=663243 RepID=UPI0032E76C25
MPVTINTIRIFKLGLQPLLILSERESGIGRRSIHAYLIWPERLEGGAEIEKLLIVSMPYHGPRNDDPTLNDALENMRLAAVEGAKHKSAKLAQHFTHLANEMTLEDVDILKLRAWRSLGFYPGLDNYQVLDASAAQRIMSLDSPYGFDVQ